MEKVRPGGFFRYWKGLSNEGKQALADDCKSSYSSLSQIANGLRPVGDGLVARLCMADNNIKPEMFDLEIAYNKAPTVFGDYWKSLNKREKEALAEASETSYGYLSQIANGICKAGAEVMAGLKKADPNITDAMLRPDLYGDEVVHDKAANG